MEIMAARVVLLDGFGLHLGAPGLDRAAVDLPRGVQRLVAYLGLSNRPARTAVAGQLWPDVSEARAHSSLRSALWRLHKAAPGLVDASSSGLALARGVRVDVRELAAWARGACDKRADGDAVVPLDVGRAGELLPGWYDDWVLLRREHVRQLHLHALEAWAERLSRAGRYGEAVQAAHVAVRAEPLRETAHRALVRIHLAEGNAAEALRAYESFRTLLREEMGLAPSRLMEALVSGLRHSEPVRALVRVDRGWAQGDGELRAARGP
jgi:DNA-binding SARP family transcriptional activator